MNFITEYIKANNNTFIPIIFSSIFGILGFLLGKIKSWVNWRREFTKERFNCLYHPYVCLYNTIHQGRALSFYDLSRIEREEILALLIKNQVYANSFLRDKINFFIQQNVRIELSSEKVSDSDFHKRDLLYYIITELIHEEWNLMQKKLYWTNVERFINWFKEKYQENQIKKRFINNSNYNKGGQAIYDENI